ncbi:MAG: hypothetical protein IT429_14920 [Gemmataceae bacterium]|nr:hypothetical protein [Gemmataceae bacterium]
MARFSTRPNPFGRPAPSAKDDDADNGEGLPSPKLLKLLDRRRAGVREARDVLASLPAPGESLHAVVTTRLDLSDVLGVILEKHGKRDRMRIATLSFNERNQKHMVGWLDAGTVTSLTLLCSLFFRGHKAGLWYDTLKQFRDRGQRAACVHSHAKVVTFAFASGARLCIEGSANLCSSSSGREQFALVNSPELHD